MANASAEASHAAVKRAAEDFGSSVQIENPAVHVITAAWLATLTDEERRQYARDVNSWQTVNIVTLPLQVGTAMYGGGGGGVPDNEVPSTFHCSLCAVVSPIDQHTSEIRILIKRPGSRNSRLADFRDLWKLIERDIALQSPEPKISSR